MHGCKCSRVIFQICLFLLLFVSKPGKTRPVSFYASADLEHRHFYLVENFLIKVLNNTGEFIMASPLRAKLIMTIATLYNKHGERNLARQVSQWRFQPSLNHLGEGIVNFLFFLYVCIRLEHDAH